MNATKFVVVCADYTTSPSRTYEEAERRLAHIESDNHCQLEHRVEEAR